MKANESEFGFILQESSIEIPFFQRAYVWEEEQWEQLFDGLKESFKEKREHFLGSIVLKQLQTSAGEGSKRSLIDGQQRLSTFTILVKCLYDKLDDDNKSDYATFLFKKPTKEKTPKIQHSKIDRESFDKILKAESYEELSEKIDKHKKDKLILCYKYFSEKIQDIENIKGFLEFILNLKLWVVINLDSNEDEQKIFDSINTAGLKLNASDIIKNALFARTIALNMDYNVLYESCWESVFESKENREFWEQELLTGTIKRAQSEIFLHAFAIIKEFFKPEDTLENLSGIYKEKIKEFNAGEFKAFLQEMKSYALVYQNFPRIEKDTYFSFDDYETRLFHILKITVINTIIPLLLRIKYVFGKNEKLLKSCFYELEKFILMRWVCKKNTKDYGKLFAKMTREFKETNKTNPLEFIKKELESKSKEIEANETRESLKCLENKVGKLILFWIELYRRNSNKQDCKELKYEYTLEHLMPQEWKANWKDTGVNEENMESLIYQIGNMTLLKGSLNKAIKNATWELKLNGKGNKKGIKIYADLSITKEIIECKKWDKKSIENRTAKLTDEFFKIWGSLS